MSEGNLTLKSGATSETVMSGLISGLSQYALKGLNAVKDFVSGKMPGESAAKAAAIKLGINSENFERVFVSDLRHIESMGNDTWKFAEGIAKEVDRMRGEGLSAEQERHAKNLMQFLERTYSVTTTRDTLLAGGDFLGAAIASRLGMDGARENGR